MALPGDVCLPQAAGSGVNLRGEAHDYLSFEDPNGDVAKMAVRLERDVREIGRYLLGPAIAAGGMATVHIGRLQGPAGFARTVAIKRLRSELAEDPAFVARFVDEARIASRVRPANVVQTLDVVSDGGLSRKDADPELLLVLDYVHGESLAKLRRKAIAANQAIPLHIVCAIIVGALRGLHAAHEATTAKGAPLHLVHRDVSPQNIIVGADGVARVIDFGIAKAVGRLHETLTQNDCRGKVAYMAPEHLAGGPVDRRCDLFPVGVMLWEAFARERLFRCEDAVRTMDAVFKREPPPLAGRVEGVTPELDAILARALAKSPERRWSTADEMARALEAALPPASDREVAEWVEMIAGHELAARARDVASFERKHSEVGEDTTNTTQQKPSGAIDVELTSSPRASRNALVPPPLDEDRMRDAAPTLNAIHEAMGGASRLSANDVTVDQPLSLPEAEPRRTPMVMVAPSTPIEARRVKKSTPIPMPAPLRDQEVPRSSALRIALLVVVPPIAAVIAVLVFRPTMSTPTRINAATMEPPPAVFAEPPPPPVVTVTAAPPPPPPTMTTPPPPVTKASAAPSSTTRRPPGRVGRPGPRHIGAKTR